LEKRVGGGRTNSHEGSPYHTPRDGHKKVFPRRRVDVGETLQRRKECEGQRQAKNVKEGRG